MTDGPPSGASPRIPSVRRSPPPGPPPLRAGSGCGRAPHGAATDRKGRPMSRRAWFPSLLRPWPASRKSGPAQRKPFTFRPWIETLEDRSLLSVTPAHLYNLNGSLTDAMGGPALVADGGTLANGRYSFNQ